MRFFNSLTKSIDEFVPGDGRIVNMYVCGLTPYDAAHIGHARSFLSFDVVKRYLTMKKGWVVNHIQNITDVEDKIIKRCRETGTDPKTLTQTNHDEALEMLGKLNILPATIYPKVTENIPEIIALIKKLLDLGFAYETETGVYYNVIRFQQYGALSGQKLDEIKAGARVEIDESKKSAMDFALWKKTKNDLIEFDSPWGRGRPGWHIECSAMALKYAGRTLDLHCGARDLIFPHHENEIAQSEAANATKFARFWLHAGFLTVNGEKMSKSLGNFTTIAQALTKFEPNAIRLFFLLTHYRSPIDYNEESIISAGESTERIFNSYGLLRETVVDKSKKNAKDPEFRTKTKQWIDSFYVQMDNDLGTPEAIACLFNLVRMANSHINQEIIDYEQVETVFKALGIMLNVLGLKETEPAGLSGKTEGIFSLLSELAIPESEKPGNAEEALQLIVDARQDARAKKDFAKADLIRKRLGELGIMIEDKATEGGIRWKLID